MEGKNKLILILQIIITVLGIFYLFEAKVMFKYYNVKALILQISYFVAWAFLIYASIRMPNKNLKKFEAILYFILDIICVALIVYSVFYVGVTYEDFLQESDAGIGYLFMFIFIGIPYFIVSAIMCIVGIIKAISVKDQPGDNSEILKAIEELERTKTRGNYF